MKHAEENGICQRCERPHDLLGSKFHNHAENLIGKPGFNEVAVDAIDFHVHGMSGEISLTSADVRLAHVRVHGV